LNKDKLQKVYQYYDGQTNDEKLTKAIMASAQQIEAKLACPARIDSHK